MHVLFDVINLFCFFLKATCLIIFKCFLLDILGNSVPYEKSKILPPFGDNMVKSLFNYFLIVKINFLKAQITNSKLLKNIVSCIYAYK